MLDAESVYALHKAAASLYNVPHEITLEYWLGLWKGKWPPNMEDPWSDALYVACEDMERGFTNENSTLECLKVGMCLWLPSPKTPFLLWFPHAVDFFWVLGKQQYGGDIRQLEGLLPWHE